MNSWDAVCSDFVPATPYLVRWGWLAESIFGRVSQPPAKILTGIGKALSLRRASSSGKSLLPDGSTPCYGGLEWEASVRVETTLYDR